MNTKTVRRTIKFNRRSLIALREAIQKFNDRPLFGKPAGHWFLSKWEVTSLRKRTKRYDATLIMHFEESPHKRVFRVHCGKAFRSFQIFASHNMKKVAHLGKRAC